MSSPRSGEERSDDISDIAAYYDKLGDRLPPALKKELDGLRDRLAKA